MISEIINQSLSKQLRQNDSEERNEERKEKERKERKEKLSLYQQRLQVVDSLILQHQPTQLQLQNYHATQQPHVFLPPPHLLNNNINNNNVNSQQQSELNQDMYCFTCNSYGHLYSDTCVGTQEITNLKPALIWESKGNKRKIFVSPPNKLEVSVVDTDGLLQINICTIGYTVVEHISASDTQIILAPTNNNCEHPFSLTRKSNMTISVVYGEFLMPGMVHGNKSDNVYSLYVRRRSLPRPTTQ